VPTPQANGSPWPGQFLEELTRLLQGDAALDFVLQDLQAIQRKSPGKFTWILLAGYLHAGHALCRHQEVASPYLPAARALAERAASFLPPGILDLHRDQ
jgi:hypothetical protein